MAICLEYFVRGFKLKGNPLCRTTLNIFTLSFIQYSRLEK